MLPQKSQSFRFLPSYLLRSLYASIVMIVILLLIAYSIRWIGTAPFLHWDERIQNVIFPEMTTTHYRLLPVAIFITSFGSFHISLLVALGVATLCWVYFRSKAYSFAVISSFTAMWGLNTLIKDMLQRERPALLPSVLPWCIAHSLDWTKPRIFRSSLSYRHCGWVYGRVHLADVYRSCALLASVSAVFSPFFHSPPVGEPDAYCFTQVHGVYIRSKQDKAAHEAFASSKAAWFFIYFFII
ncbi:hypothetical protein [Paenibacillus peoriae]|uniref:hypothetical protein n=1 Tax=Paenibacillus peoriae TaxID=59893 RepID=UPI00026C5B14